MDTSRCDVLAGAGLLADQGTTTVNRMFGGSRGPVREEPGTAPDSADALDHRDTRRRSPAPDAATGSIRAVS